MIFLVVNEVSENIMAMALVFPTPMFPPDRAGAVSTPFQHRVFTAAVGVPNGPA